MKNIPIFDKVPSFLSKIDSCQMGGKEGGTAGEVYVLCIMGFSFELYFSEGAT
jgi:hypothetical protein